jgi:CheY-like chemotaxis protein
VLLVEDQSIIALATTARLSREGYEVSVARSGEHAIELVESAQPGDDPYRLILMDINLGAGIDGVEAARRFLARHEVPIVFLTSHTEPEYVDRVREVTRYGYVLKSSGELILRLSMEMAVDLFEANQLTRRQEAELEAIYDHAPIAMLVVDADARVVKANARARTGVRLPGDARDADATAATPSMGRIVDCVRAAADPEACGRYPDCARCGLRALVTETLDSGVQYHEVEVTIEITAAGGTTEETTEKTVSVSTAPIDHGGQRRALVSIIDLDALCEFRDDEGP